MTHLSCEILYHLSKSNVVVVAMSCVTTNVPLIGLCLRMPIVKPLLEIIGKARTKAIKVENQKTTWVKGQTPIFIKDSRDFFTRYGQI